MLVPYKKSSYGGFVLDTFNLDINSYSKNFNDIEGSNTSKYAIILLSSTISSSNYDKIIFTNDLSLCESELFKWLNHENDSSKYLEVKHYYGIAVDLLENKEIGHGDIFNDGSGGWNKFTGINTSD